MIYIYRWIMWSWMVSLIAHCFQWENFLHLTSDLYVTFFHSLIWKRKPSGWMLVWLISVYTSPGNITVKCHVNELQRMYTVPPAWCVIVIMQRWYFLHIHTCQVTLDIPGSPIDLQWWSGKYPGQSWQACISFKIASLVPGMITLSNRCVDA